MVGLFIRVTLTTGTSALSTERAAGFSTLAEPGYDALNEAVRLAFDRMLADLAQQRIADLAKAPAA